jgi:4,5-DOPA dioxygenase extradiol
MSEIMPAIFFGHGNPMNALSQNTYTEGWRQIGQKLPKPKAILSVSAHWFISKTAVTIASQPRTIHDFGGFPPPLYEVQYPAPGHPNLARRVQQMLAPAHVDLDNYWGLDHGTWSVLCHVYPNADVPVVQLSIDETQSPDVHYRIGQSLAPLRREGILIIGSGNIVHNLHTYAWGRRAQKPYDWAVSFETRVRRQLVAHEHQPLINYQSDLGSEAVLAAPTPDHYLPLLYVIGTRQHSDQVAFPVEGVDGGSISMLTVQVG